MLSFFFFLLSSSETEFLESASPSAYVKGGEAHIPAVIFHKHRLSLVIGNTHWQPMKNNPSRSVSGFCGLQGVSKGIFQMGSGKQTLAEFNSREDVAWIPGGKIKKGHGRQDQYFTAGTSVTGDLSLVCRLLGVSLCVSYCRSARFLGCCFSLP